MIRKFTLRVPEKIAQQLDDLRQPGQSQQGQIIEILKEHTGNRDPKLVLGFTELVRGKIRSKPVCSKCGRKFSDKSIWLGYTADLKPFGPICQDCAKTE